MTWQPAAIAYPDIELELTGRYRAALAARSETYAQGVYVGITSSPVDPTTGQPKRRDRMVVIRRDGGTQTEMRDRPRVTLLVWAMTEQDATNLAALVMALAPSFVDGAPILAVPNDGKSGPYPVADDSGQSLRQMSIEFHTRGVAL